MDKINIRKWVLTPHAVQRIFERNISIDEIRDILDAPDMIKQQGPKYILAKSLSYRTDNKIACVVLEKKENDLWVVVTVMHNFKES